MIIFNFEKKLRSRFEKRKVDQISCRHDTKESFTDGKLIDGPKSAEVVRQVSLKFTQ